MPRKMIYRKGSGDITFLDTLEVVTLNETAQFVFDKLRHGVSGESLVAAVIAEYDIDFVSARADCEEIVSTFKKWNLDIASASNLGSSAMWTPKTAIVHIIKNCNSACAMCDCWKTKTNVFLSRKTLKPYFEKLASHGASSVMVSGGEPLMHPELKGILNDIRDSGMSRSLNTNGLLLHKNTWLRDEGIEQLVMSMDGIDNASYKLFRGANAFAALWKAIKEYKESAPGTKTGIRVTVNRTNFTRMKEIFRLADEHLVDNIGFSPADIDSSSFARESMNQENSTRLLELMIPTIEEIDDFLQSFIPGDEAYDIFDSAGKAKRSQWDASGLVNCLRFYRKLRTGEKSFFPSDPCLFPRVAMVVDYGGELRNCFYSESFGNLESLRSANWNLDTNLDALKNSGKCTACRGKIFCDANDL